MAKGVALSTVDNPFNPFTQFRDWFNFDIDHGYDCCAIVGRLAVTSNELLPTERSIILEAAINRFVEADPIGLYCKVVDDSNEN